MRARYYFEIVDSASPDCTFVYFDTAEHLADPLFAHLDVKIRVEGEYGNDEEPFRMIMCSVTRPQRESFLKIVDLLPAVMRYAGHTGYDAYCRGVMLQALKLGRGRLGAGRQEKRRVPSKVH